MRTANLQDEVSSNGIGSPLSVGKWGFDISHSKLGFTISHFGISETEGRFTQFEGTVLSGNPDFSDSKIDLTIDVASINTEDVQRDIHLKSADFFDVTKFPLIIFKSRAIASLSKHKYKLTGDLTMHGITREIVLDVVYKGTVDDPFNNTKAGFTVTGEIDRTKFGLTWNGVLAAGGLLVGNSVYFSINMELIKI